MELKKRGRDRAKRINMQRMSRGRVNKEAEMKQWERRNSRRQGIQGTIHCVERLN